MEPLPVFAEKPPNKAATTRIAVNATYGKPASAKQNPLWDKGFSIGFHRFPAEGTGVEPATGKAGI